MTALKRRAFVALVPGALMAPLDVSAAPAPATPRKKVLRYAFEVAETSLDPARVNDLYSRTLTPHIFEGLYHYDHLARPIKIKPLTADGMPQPSSDFRAWTINAGTRRPAGTIGSAAPSSSARSINPGG